WTSQRMPTTKKAMAHIEEAAEFYAQFPQVRGAAIYGRGSRQSGLSRQAGRLLEPMAAFCRETTFEIEEEDEFTPFVPPPMSADAGVAAMGEPTAQPNGRFIADVTIPDDTRLETGESFTKTWRVKNTGNTAWEDYKLVHTDGAAMTTQKSISLPDINPGRLGLISLELTAPNTPGTHFTDWRFQDDESNFFGDILYARIVAERPSPTHAGKRNAQFLKDVTIPDDTEIEPGKAFTKTWQVKNNGETAWGSGFTLRFIGGTTMTASENQPLPQTAKGATTNISVKLTAPKSPGIYHGDWRLFDAHGEPFGDTVFLRIVVPAPAGSTLVAPMSQRDPRWADKMLGHAGSPTTIGKWGCLLTCFAMTANALEHETDSSRLNDAMLSNGGFLNGYFTKWNALTEVYADIVYEGKMDAHPNVMQFIDASLANGRPISALVDFTRDTPYSDNDQHWVLIVGKDGDDYRINDPWLLPAQEASLRARYGRAGQSLSQIIRSAIFYRSTKQPIPKPDPKPVPTTPKRLQTGMNVNPDAPHSNPMDGDSLKGMDWVRFVFKLDARVNEAERGNWDIAFAQFDNIVRKYNRQGTKSLIIINQETIWGIAPWTGNGNWQGYADQFAAAAGKIAAHFKGYGDQIAYQIWNEGDKKHNPASVYLEPEQFAQILGKAAAAMRTAAPDAQIVSNGMATGPEESVAYLKRVQAALGGKLPVDAVGIHPYTRWATRAPFDWGSSTARWGRRLRFYVKGCRECSSGSPKLAWPTTMKSARSSTPKSAITSRTCTSM
ncbi:MAG: NBR1-Ig-like domain-containing protein, partial [Anaerolineae bacterium]